MDNRTKFFLIVIAILALLITFGFIHFSNKVSKLEEENKSKTIPTEVVDTKPKLKDSTSAVVSPKDGVLVPRVVYRDTGSTKYKDTGSYHVVYDTIRDIDTVEVIKDFFSLKTFKDSIYKQDVSLVVFDTLQRNSILGRRYMVRNDRTEDFFKRRMFYIGGMLGGSETSFMVGPTLQYLDKQDNLLGASYLLTPDGSNTILLNYARKIRLKK